MDTERLGSSITDVIERAGVRDRLDLLFPLTASNDLLRLLLLLPDSAMIDIPLNSIMVIKILLPYCSYSGSES